MRFVFLFLMIFSIMPGFAGVKEKSGTSHGKRGDAKTPLVEYVGVVCPDTAKMFLLEDFPAVLSRSQSQVFTSLSRNVRISPDSLPMIYTECRYLSYIKINAQSYRYGSAEKGVNVAKTLAPLVWPIPVGAMVRGGYVSPGLELSVDYTLCLYDISTQTTLVMHPFLFETEQSKKDRRKIQLMQPEGVPVDYPLIDEFHEALVAEYDILLKKLGIK